MQNLTIISQIKSDDPNVEKIIESILYFKATKLLKEIELQEAAILLLCADPTPAIFDDEKGNPVLPSPQHWLQHYQGIEASHVKAQLRSAKERLQRWYQASHSPEDKHAAAELRNLKTNIATGERVLRQKEKGVAKFAKSRAKKFKANATAVNKTVHQVIHPLLGGSAIANHIAHGLATAIAKHIERKDAAKK